MGLLEDIEDMKKELSEIEEGDEKETVVEEDTEEASDEDTDESAEEDSSEDEESAEENKEEEKPKVEAKKEELDDRGHARLRREKDAAERKARELEEKIAELTSGEKEEVENPLDKEIARVIEKNRFDDAKQEFLRLEADFRRREPQYDEVVSQYVPALIQSIRIQNPRISIIEAQAQAEKAIILKASQYAREGFDPIEELYEEARSLDLKPGKQDEPEEETEEKKRPDLNKVAKNRARNAGTAGSKGRGGNANITREVAAEMPAHEWAKLPIEERKRLMSGV